MSSIPVDGEELAFSSLSSVELTTCVVAVMVVPIKTPVWSWGGGTVLVVAAGAIGGQGG